MRARAGAKMHSAPALEWESAEFIACAARVSGEECTWTEVAAPLPSGHSCQVRVVEGIAYERQKDDETMTRPVVVGCRAQYSKHTEKEMSPIDRQGESGGEREGERERDRRTE